MSNQCNINNWNYCFQMLMSVVMQPLVQKIKIVSTLLVHTNVCVNKAMLETSTVMVSSLLTIWHFNWMNIIYNSEKFWTHMAVKKMAMKNTGCISYVHVPSLDDLRIESTIKCRHSKYKNIIYAKSCDFWISWMK